ncbi:MAG: hypothetical protein AB7I18_03200 [Candidatus Berkiella sp.]
MTEDRHIERLKSLMEKIEVKSYNELRSLCHQRHIARKLQFLNTNIRY